MSGNKITFTFNKDVRCYKEGTKATLVVGGKSVVWVVGGNLSGKSTLLQLMRSRKDSMGSEYNMMSSVLNKLKSEDVDIDGLDAYDNVFYLDSVIDDPMSYENSASADLFLEGGGYYMQKQSKGQKALSMLNKFLSQIDKVRSENGADTQTKTLIVLDEVDEGLDVGKQSKFIKLLDAMVKKYNADLVVVCHSILPIVMSDNHEVWSVEYGCPMSLEEYLSLAIDKRVKICVEDFDEEDRTKTLIKILERKMESRFGDSADKTGRR